MQKLLVNNTTMSEKRLDNRKIYIDIIKIFAIFCILFNHTGTRGFVLFLKTEQSIISWFYMFVGIFIKVAIPLFFMVSGALLLGKNESIRVLLKKRIIKYLLILILASFISYIYFCVRETKIEFSLNYFIKTLYSKGLNVSYWYLYMYISYILMLPILRKLARTMTNKEYNWMFVMFAGIQILSIVEFLIWKGEITLNSNLNLITSCYYLFYPLMGYYIDTKINIDEFNKKNLLKLILLSFIVITITCLLTKYRCMILNIRDENDSQIFFNTLIFIPAITIFYGVKMLFIKHPATNKTIKIASTISGTVLGIYLFEHIWREETKKVFYILSPHLGDWLACVVWILLACLLGGIITFLIKKIIFLLKNIVTKKLNKSEG